MPRISLAGFTDEQKRARLREQKAAYMRRARQNPEVRQRHKDWLSANREKVSSSALAWKRSNKDRVRIHRKNSRPASRARVNERYRSEPAYRVSVLSRCRIRTALNGAGKSQKTTALVGCSPQFFADYLESLFLPGMTWKNHGEWHIDHIIPISKFDLSDDEQARRAFHYSNCRPLWAEENMKKGSRIAA